VEREPVARGNDLFVPLRKGEVYRIQAENKSGELVLMRLLVDGLNTLPQLETDKDMVVEPVPKNQSPGTRQERWVTAPRVNLNDARAWILDPKSSKSTLVRGFFSSTAGGGKYNEFVVVDAQDSLAARQRFTDQIGLITAAFYAPKSDARGLGTTLGKEGTGRVAERAGIACGNLLGVVHLRYVEPEAIEVSLCGGRIANPSYEEVLCKTRMPGID
jgi:hypothetical protein